MTHTRRGRRGEGKAKALAHHTKIHPPAVAGNSAEFRTGLRNRDPGHGAFPLLDTSTSAGSEIAGHRIPMADIRKSEVSLLTPA